MSPRLKSPAPRDAGGPNRRGVLAGTLAAVPLAIPLPGAAAAATGEAGAAFGFADAVAEARTLAEAPYRPADQTLTAPFEALDYDRYRAIRFRREADPLAGHGAFGLDLLPPGSVFRTPVEILLVEDGAPRPIPFDAGVFDFDPRYFALEGGRAPEGAGAGLAWSGFRLRYPMSRPETLDEFAVFQGASYFRAVGRDMVYGLAARGLALATADPAGEEFPAFRRFWIHRPAPSAAEITVHALLDSPSCAGAFEFRIRPGDTTVMDTRCRLFPRREIATAGLAPLNSMFFFGPGSRAGIDDWRDAVHDSEGLQMVTGMGQRLWRPLANPPTVQVSAFVDAGPRGFGLAQRRRRFADYQDAEARYDRRPSAWVEPLAEPDSAGDGGAGDGSAGHGGAWAEGAVLLVEIPVDSPFNDNIVAFWRPAAPLAPRDAGHALAYRIHWCDRPPDRAALARVSASRSGSAVTARGRRRMVVDFDLDRDRAGMAAVTPRLETTAASAGPVTLIDLPEGTGCRAAFGIDPAEAGQLEFRLTLDGPDGPLSETWLSRWSAP
ncbi:MAG: glucan biosynthesis protein [Pseudomonadota bacterium]